MRLLIATAAVVERAAQLPAGVRLLIEAASEVWVMSPSLVGPVQWLTGGVDDARQSAEERLAVVLDQLAAQGIAAQGTRGDELGPTAFDDVLGRFAAEHVIVSLGTTNGAWQRDKAIKHLVERRGVPVTIFTVGH